jgi:hypothetical protein
MVSKTTGNTEAWQTEENIGLILLGFPKILGFESFAIYLDLSLQKEKTNKLDSALRMGQRNYEIFKFMN